MLTAPDLGFRRRTRRRHPLAGAGRLGRPRLPRRDRPGRRQPAGPVLVVGILAVSLLTMPFSGSLAAREPDHRVAHHPGVRQRRRGDRQLPPLRDQPAHRPEPTSRRYSSTPCWPWRTSASTSTRASTPEASSGPLWADIQGGGYVEGGSTITQQYVRLAYLERRAHRRPQAPGSHPRRPGGEGAQQGRNPLPLPVPAPTSAAAPTGSAPRRRPTSASRCDDLTLTEAAMLAGMLSAPSFYDPRSNPGEAEYQRQRVLGKMADQGKISPVQYNQALPLRVTLADNLPRTGAAPATVVQPVKQPPSKYPWFTDYVRGYLIAKYGDDKVYSGGLRVETVARPRPAGQGRGCGQRGAEGHRSAAGHGPRLRRPQDRPGAGRWSAGATSQVTGEPRPRQLPGAQGARRPAKVRRRRRARLRRRRRQRPPAGLVVQALHPGRGARGRA